MAYQTDQNRAHQDATNQQKGRDWRSWISQAFSKALNFRTERSCANPDYGTFRRQAVASADTAPNTAEPAFGWDLKGYWGLHGYLEFDGGTSPSADLQLWARAGDGRNEWYLVEEKSGVGEFEEFHFDGKIRNRQVALVVSALYGSPTNVDIICSPE